MSEYKAVKITKGKRGWGGPLVIQPTEKKKYIYCVTGGGIHPVAQRIADLTGAEAFDGFSSKREFDEMAVAVIDCGGTARVGVYPMKGVLTVDIHATKPSGPLFRFIKEDLFVSGVSVNDIVLVDGETPPAEATPPAEEIKSVPDKPLAPKASEQDTAVPAAELNKKKGFFQRLFGG
ncbi:MAG: PTS sorbitol transporter [Chloroflexota bacterium]